MIFLDFLVGITCFLTLPALLAIIAQMHVYRIERDKTATPYLAWLLANPAGVALIPLATFLLLVLYRANWNLFVAFTRPEISGNVLVPVVFTAILAVANVFYRYEQRDKKMEIIQELKAQLDARDAKYEQERQVEREKQAKEREEFLAELRALRQGATEIEKKQAYLQGQMDARAGKVSDEYSAL